MGVNHGSTVTRSLGLAGLLAETPESTHSYERF